LPGIAVSRARHRRARRHDARNDPFRSIGARGDDLFDIDPTHGPESFSDEQISREFCRFRRAVEDRPAVRLQLIVRGLESVLDPKYQRLDEILVGGRPAIELPEYIRDVGLRRIRHQGDDERQRGGAKFSDFYLLADIGCLAPLLGRPVALPSDYAPRRR
jgi:hypothetical protein